MLRNPYVAVTVVVTALIVLYALSCWVFPFAKCVWCKGLGRHERDDRKVWRTCWRCKGVGRRIRVGRWLFNRLWAARQADRRASRG